MLSPEPRTELWPLLVAGFGKGSNPMWAFVIGEVLGGRCGGEEALGVLSALAETAAMPARSLVPHGLEALARATEDVELRRRAISRLHELKADGEAQVREEACIALRNAGES